MGRILLRPVLCLALLACIFSSSRSPVSLTLISIASALFVALYIRLATGRQAVAVAWVVLVTFVLPVAVLFALSHHAVGSWGESVLYLGRSLHEQGVVTSLATLTAPSAAALIAAVVVSRHAL